MFPSLSARLLSPHDTKCANTVWPSDPATEYSLVCSPEQDSNTASPQAGSGPELAADDSKPLPGKPEEDDSDAGNSDTADEPE